MQPTTETDYKQLFSQLIKKQMLVLGPDITLAKVRNVTGITVDINGDVQKIDGEPQLLLQALINQFVELSGMIVKKTMESILTSYPGMMAMAAAPVFGGAPVQVSTQPVKPEVTIQAATSVPTTPSTNTVSEPESTSTTDTADIKVTVTEPTNVAQHIEPPAMSSISLESLSTKAPEEKKETPASFSTEEMADLNKALEDLSKAPLSTEKPAST